VDVFAYRGWIYSTMGMNPEQADGQVRLRWFGRHVAARHHVAAVPVGGHASRRGVDERPGSEIAMNGCDDVRVFCQPQGANLNMFSFTQKTFAANGALTSTQTLRSCRRSPSPRPIRGRRSSGSPAPCTTRCTRWSTSAAACSRTTSPLASHCPLFHRGPGSSRGRDFSF
jgi:hypothetical protein